MLKKQLSQEIRKIDVPFEILFRNDDDSGVAYQEALNEITRYREIIRNKYRKFIK